MSQWTPERRLRQSQLIQDWKPWTKSTGAKTKDGKEISKMNAYKHGAYGAFMKALRRELTQYNLPTRRSSGALIEYLY
jgi:hypothetical protein